MNCRRFQPADEEAWDAFVAEHPDATPYHRVGWMRSIEAAYGHAPRYLVAEDAGQLVGVLPAFRFSVPLKGSRWVSSPFCDVGGVLALSDAAATALLAAAEEQARAEGAQAWVCRDGNVAQPRATSCGIDEAQEKVRMLLSLPDSADALLASFKAKLRSQVKKAEKNQCTFEWAEAEELEAFYSIFSVNMRDLGSPVHSRDLFSEILRHYGEGARLGIVRADGQPAAAGILLSVGKRIGVPWASSLRAYNRLAPNMLLYWNFLRYASDAGFDQFDFGRSTKGEGTYRFKQQWGAKPQTLGWYRVDLSASAGATAARHGDSVAAAATRAGNISEGESSLRPLIQKAWSKLPLAVANQVGPRIRKYISL